MGKSLDDIMTSLPAERRERIEKRGQEIIDEVLTLQALRNELNLTQGRLAELLHMKQSNVSKVEQRSDMLISTLRNYIEAMGGELELVAKLPGRRPVKLDGLSDLSNQQP